MYDLVHEQIQWRRRRVCGLAQEQIKDTVIPLFQPMLQEQLLGTILCPQSR